MADRRVVIMRHGKAEQSETKRDIDRALIARGEADAQAGGVWLAQHGYAPDVVLCSPARRTRSTWHAVAAGLADGGSAAAPTVTYVDDLYYAGVGAALERIRAVPDAAGTVLVIGHNPTVSGLSHRLAERDSVALKTSEIAVHEATGAWSSLSGADFIDGYAPRS